MSTQKYPHLQFCKLANKLTDVSLNENVILISHLNTTYLALKLVNVSRSPHNCAEDLNVNKELK